MSKKENATYLERISQLERDLETTKSQVTTAENKSTGLAMKLQMAEEANRQLNEDLSTSLEAQEATKAHFNQRIAELEGKANKELAAAHNAISKLEGELSAKNDECAAEWLRIFALESHVAELDTYLAKSMEEGFKLSSSLSRLEAAKAAFESEFAASQTSAKSLVESLDNLKNRQSRKPRPKESRKRPRSFHDDSEGFNANPREVGVTHPCPHYSTNFSESRTGVLNTVGGFAVVSPDEEEYSFANKMLRDLHSETSQLTHDLRRCSKNGRMRRADVPSELVPMVERHIRQFKGSHIGEAPPDLYIDVAGKFPECFLLFQEDQKPYLGRPLNQTPCNGRYCKCKGERTVLELCPNEGSTTKCRGCLNCVNLGCQEEGYCGWCTAPRPLEQEPVSEDNAAQEGEPQLPEQRPVSEDNAAQEDELQMPEPRPVSEDSSAQEDAPQLPEPQPVSEDNAAQEDEPQLLEPISEGKTAHVGEPKDTSKRNDTSRPHICPVCREEIQLSDGITFPSTEPIPSYIHGPKKEFGKARQIIRRHCHKRRHIVPFEVATRADYVTNQSFLDATGVQDDSQYTKIGTALLFTHMFLKHRPGQQGQSGWDTVRMMWQKLQGNMKTHSVQRFSKIIHTGAVQDTYVKRDEQQEQGRRAEVRRNLQTLMGSCASILLNQASNGGYEEFRRSITSVFAEQCGTTHGDNISQMVCLRLWYLAGEATSKDE